MAQLIKVAATEDILPGQAKMVEVEGNEIAIFNIDGEYYAVDNSCTHVGGPLCEGEINAFEVTCPWHGAVFDVTSGHALGPPAALPLTTYVVRVQDGNICIEI